MNNSTTTNERAYVSDPLAYETFVGGITPQEFIEPYSEFESPADEAIKDLIRTWSWEEAPPAWLEDALYRHIERHT